MNSTRVHNSKRNIISGILRQITLVCLSFVTRTIILYSLGKEYLGLEGLFTSIMQVLNLVDLDFATIFLILLYKPVAEGDTNRICAILNCLKRIYFKVGIIILGVGLLFIPFLEILVPNDRPDDINLYLLYLIFLLNASLTYMFFSYKGIFLIAAQRKDIENKIHILVTITIKAVQILAVLIFTNYYLYIVFLPVGTLVANFLIHRRFDKLFPDYKPDGTMDAESKKKFDEQIWPVFLGKVGDIARNGFDGIIITSSCGLVAEAVYGNYMYIFTALYAVMGIIINGIKASVGNAIATTDLTSNYNNMRKINLLFMWLITWCSICLLCIYQPFMMIWMKNDVDMLLDMKDVGLFSAYFYAINMTYIGNMYFDAKGLFYEGRVWLALEAAANVILNFALGYFLGITGVLIATLITVIFFTMICRTCVLFKCYFKKKTGQYFVDHIVFVIVFILTGGICLALTEAIPFSGYLGLMAKGLVCVVVPNVFILFCYSRLPLWREAVDFTKSLIGQG